MPAARRPRSSALPPGSRGRNVIGNRLFLARHHHTPPLTAEALSTLVFDRTGTDISGNMISKIENGLRVAYDYEVRAFADALAVSTDWLLGRTDER